MKSHAFPYPNVRNTLPNITWMLSLNNVPIEIECNFTSVCNSYVKKLGENIQSSGRNYIYGIKSCVLYVDMKRSGIILESN